MTSRLAGLLVGTAVGDAIGLPAEGLRPERIRRLFRGPLRHRLVFGRGMVSDDTEHALFVAQALLVEREDPERFQRLLAWKLKGWLLGLPAGIGFATLRSILKLWLFVPPSHSGVFSAGNGPAMRSALLGAVLGEDRERLRAFVAASTRLTHTDPKAETGALAIALAASWAVRGDGPEYGPLRPSTVSGGPEYGPGSRATLLDELGALAPGDGDWKGLVAAVARGLDDGQSAAAFAAGLGLAKGVTGYVYHTVPVALFVFLSHPTDFRRVIEEVVALGGDTDTVAAIAGALAGAAVGLEGLPEEWVLGIADWPRSVGVLREAASRLARDERRPVRYFWPGLIVRNAVFLLIVLAHGFRRLLPPYAASSGRSSQATRSTSA